MSVVTGGADVHRLVLVDLRDSDLDGQPGGPPDGIGNTANRNAVPFEPRPPIVSSGLRIGTPAFAIRGFGNDFREVLDIIASAP